MCKLFVLKYNYTNTVFDNLVTNIKNVIENEICSD